MDYESYTPIDPDFYDIIELIVLLKAEIRIFYFLPDQTLGEVNGEFLKTEKSDAGEFVLVEDQVPVRLDRVITINGKPGPAYGEYEAYADQCLTCRAGYDEIS